VEQIMMIKILLLSHILLSLPISVTNYHWLSAIISLSTLWLSAVSKFHKIIYANIVGIQFWFHFSNAVTVLNCIVSNIYHCQSLCWDITCVLLV
jgi:hypothetical protein